jgi:regulatory protein
MQGAVCESVPTEMRMAHRKLSHSNKLYPAADPLEQAAIRFLARRDRTEAHMRAYLAKAGATPAHAQAIISSLRTRRYLNDTAYALKWARARLGRRPMGRDRLEAELHGQGMDAATVTRTLDVVYDETSERELAHRLMARKTPSPALLRRHGFSEEIIETFFGEAQQAERSCFSGE